MAEAAEKGGPPLFAGDAGGNELPDFSVVLPAAGFAVYEWDLVSDRLSWNGEVEQVLGVPLSAISSGRAYLKLVDPKGPPSRQPAILEEGPVDEGDGVCYHAEYRLYPGDPNAEALWLQDSGRWYAGPDGRPARAHGVIRAIAERRARDESFFYRSNHDDLTGTLNRPRLIEELTVAIEDAEICQTSSAFAMIAVDNLSIVNDAYGFDVADEVIAGTAKRISREMRGGDSIGRLSGNKLGVVLNACDEQDLKIALERFSHVVGASGLPTRTGTVAASVSIGGVVIPVNGRSASAAMMHAQEALDQARLGGCRGLVVYEPSPVREAARKQNAHIAEQIVSALNERRFGLILQPVVTVVGGDTVYHEALCRIVLEDGSRIAAAEFIGTAERLGVVRLVDHRTLDLAIARLTADPSLVLAINVSTASALDGSWLGRLQAHLRRFPGLTGRIIVEITETMAIRDIQWATAFVGSLRELGCRVAIDDFGSGHTSFRSLRDLGADIVKIDGAFVERIAENDEDKFFVKTLVSLARKVGLSTVAEKVSSEIDAEVLRELGVDFLQGNYFGAGEEIDDTSDRQAASIA